MEPQEKKIIYFLFFLGKKKHLAYLTLIGQTSLVAKTPQ